MVGPRPYKHCITEVSLAPQGLVKNSMSQAFTKVLKFNSSRCASTWSPGLGRSLFSFCEEKAAQLLEGLGSNCCVI